MSSGKRTRRPLLDGCSSTGALAVRFSFLRDWPTPILSFVGRSARRAEAPCTVAPPTLWLAACDRVSFPFFVVAWPVQPLEVYAGLTKSLSIDSAGGPSSVCPAEIFKSQIFWEIIGEIAVTLHMAMSVTPATVHVNGRGHVPREATRDVRSRGLSSRWKFMRD